MVLILIIWLSWIGTGPIDSRDAIPLLAARY